MDGTYRAEAVAEFLFVCYLNAGQGLIEQTNSDIAPIQRAIEYFSSALAIHPRNQPAADARRLGSLYLEAVRALASEDLPEAQTRLEALLLEAPTYANGRAAQRLYSLLIKRAEVALRDGNILAAIRFYQQAQTVAVADHSTAMAGEKYARAITPTPTPSPTRTPRPTLLPVTPTPYAVVRTGVLNLRAGPGTSYPVLGQARTADALAITGRNTDGSWLQVCCVSARMGAESSGGELRGRTGWVAAGLVEVQGDLAFLAVIALPPLPTSTPQPPTASRHLCMSGRVRDAAGNPLAGWTIVLQPPVGSSQTQRTDNNGIYQFNDLAAGTYMISELLESGWRAISPQSSTVEVVPADICLAVDFWNERLEKSAAPARPTEVPTLASPTPPR
jgi:hypothetical protein